MARYSCGRWHSRLLVRQPRQPPRVAGPRSAYFFSKALFSSEKISDFGTVAFLFLFNKHYPIID